MYDFISENITLIAIPTLLVSYSCFVIGMTIFKRKVNDELRNLGFYPTTKSYAFFFITLYECIRIKVEMNRENIESPKYLNKVIYFLSVAVVAIIFCIISMYVFF